FLVFAGEDCLENVWPCDDWCFSCTLALSVFLALDSCCCVFRLVDYICFPIFILDVIFLHVSIHTYHGVFFWTHHQPESRGRKRPHNNRNFVCLSAVLTYYWMQK
ncbi:unnamed protein product, partial [Ectocarpus sp. 4 AP-2014]